MLLAERGEETKETSVPVYWIRQGLAFLDRSWGYWLVGLCAVLLSVIALRSPDLADSRFLVKTAGCRRFARGHRQSLVRPASCAAVLPSRETFGLQCGFPFGRGKALRMDLARRIVVDLFCRIARMGRIRSDESRVCIPRARHTGIAVRRLFADLANPPETVVYAVSCDRCHPADRFRGGIASSEYCDSSQSAVPAFRLADFRCVFRYRNAGYTAHRRDGRKSRRNILAKSMHESVC